MSFSYSSQRREEKSDFSKKSDFLSSHRIDREEKSDFCKNRISYQTKKWAMLSDAREEKSDFSKDFL
jgi:hypothetical protein